MKYGYLPDMRKAGFTGRPSPSHPHIIWFESFEEARPLYRSCGSTAMQIGDEVLAWMDAVVYGRTPTPPGELRPLYWYGPGGATRLEGWEMLQIPHRFQEPTKFKPGPLERGYVCFAHHHHAMLFKLTFAGR